MNSNLDTRINDYELSVNMRNNKPPRYFPPYCPSSVNLSSGLSFFTNEDPAKFCERIRNALETSTYPVVFNRFERWIYAGSVLYSETILRLRLECMRTRPGQDAKKYVVYISSSRRTDRVTFANWKKEMYQEVPDKIWDT